MSFKCHLCGIQSCLWRTFQISHLRVSISVRMLTMESKPVHLSQFWNRAFVNNLWLKPRKLLMSSHHIVIQQTSSWNVSSGTGLSDSQFVLVYHEQYLCCVRWSSFVTSNTLSNAGGVRVNTGQKRSTEEQRVGMEWYVVFITMG